MKWGRAAGIKRLSSRHRPAATACSTEFVNAAEVGRVATAGMSMRRWCPATGDRPVYQRVPRDVGLVVRAEPLSTTRPEELFQPRSANDPEFLPGT